MLLLFQSEFVQCSTSKLARIGPGVVRLPWKRSPKRLMWTGQMHVTICFIYQIKETNTTTDIRKKLRVSQLNAIRRHVIPAPQRTGPCTLTGPRIDLKKTSRHHGMYCVHGFLSTPLLVASGGERHERSSLASTANAS